jgi:hypothetical protein
VSYLNPVCDRCGKEFHLGDRAVIITKADVYMIDVTSGQPRARTTERRVLVCEAPCV